MSDIQGFSADLKKFEDSLGIRTKTIIKKIALQIFIGIVKKTPVDTGRARSSWVIGVDQRPVLSEKIDPGRQELSGAQATAQAMREIAELSKIKPDSTIFISNALPYIEKLENGSSKQAPEGMVAVTVAEVERDLKRITDDF